MPLNKIFLDKDGLTVGNGQLVASANAVYVGNALTVNGNLFAKGLANTVTLTFEYDANNTKYNSKGYVTAFVEGTVATSNVVYDSLNRPISWIETDFGICPGSNVSYTYTATYDGAGQVSRITRR